MNSESDSPLDDAEIVQDNADSDDAGTETPSVGESPAETMGTIDRFAASLLVHWRPILLTASVIATVGLAACLFVLQYRPDRQIDDAAARQAIHAASDGAVASLSYTSDSMARDFASAKSHLTGEFLAYYEKFTKDVVTPTVQQKHITQTATVLRAAISELHPDSAVVLVFLNETTASKEKPEPLTTPSSVRVTLTKVNGSWLISKLDPFG
jgi:Mce-associated membrane protein